MKSRPSSHKKWYQTPVGIITLLILFFPVGLYLMWKYSGWNKIAMWVISGFFGLIVLGNAFGGDGAKTSTATTESTQAPLQQSQSAISPTEQQEQEQTKGSANTTTAPTQTKQVAKPTTPPSSSSVTTSQKNAVKKAQSYLSFSGFSRDGLVAQLEYEQFSHEDAVYGADNAGGDWMNEAAQKAKSYMEFSSFSRGGLIDQLKYEKFTQEQAEYGANSVGL